MTTNEMALKALERNGNTMGKKTISVTASSQEELEETKRKSKATKVIKMTRFPATATNEDVTKYFAPLQIEKIYLVEKAGTCSFTKRKMQPKRYWSMTENSLERKLLSFTSVLNRICFGS